MDSEQSSPRKNEKGFILILMAFAMVGLIGAASLAVDIGSALVTKAELQNVADASSLAATRELALIYKGFAPNTNYKTHTLQSSELAQIKAKALAFAAANQAGGLSITVGDDDVVTATYDIATGAITPSTTGVRAVRVIGRRDDTQNGQVQTALGRVLGINSIAITASSTAAISAMGKLKSGKGEFPIALDEDWWDSHGCETNEELQFHPTAPASCLGWHTFEDGPANAMKLKDQILPGIQDGTFQSPVTTAGETYYEFIAGTVSSALMAAEDLFNAKATGSPPTWVVNAPVYESADCENPNGSRLIVGFTKVRLTKVQAPPDAEVLGDVECGVYDQDDDVGEGGGPGDFGVLIGTPGMIE